VSAAAVLPLENIRVVEIAQNLAGPMAAEILAHMGADVVKVERPEGDDARKWGPPFWKGVSPGFLAVNANKRGITLDLKDPESVAWLMDFLGDADVLVQNLRPGSLEELGLGPDVLLARHPRLVYCSVWAFGSTGPLKLKPGFEPMVQAFSGLMMMNGDEGGPPTRIGTSILDYGTGMWTAMGALAGLVQRQRTGRGCVVDASLYETGLAWLKGHFASFRASGEVPERHRTGSQRVVPFQGFETKTGTIIVAAGNDRLFASWPPSWAIPSGPRRSASPPTRRASPTSPRCWPCSKRSSRPAPRASGSTCWRRAACRAARSTACPRRWPSRRPRPSASSSACPATTTTWSRCRSPSTASARPSAAPPRASASTTKRYGVGEA
jgi:crotonobetainyl-CoA:carnitine CoA-transferase CaiB-like acyl-CoA transferase